jgi:alpha/beta superfamily hydrolase
MHAIRFNFRGVGSSDGQYDNGVGEVDDVLAVLNWAKQNWPTHKICLAGFSFGAYVSARAAMQQPVAMLISIAPPVTYENFNQINPNAPWVVIHGDDDELIPAQTVVDWIAHISPQPELIRIAHASHFFHGKLVELRTILNNVIKKYFQ